MKTARTILTLAAVAIVAAPALADWDPGQSHKMHFPQLPDLSPEGMDVLDGPITTEPGTAEYYEKFLADDWVCSSSGYVTDIHFWGSYNEDHPLTDIPRFSLVIYDNIPPEESPTTYSMPGNPLWDAYVYPTAERVYALAPEQFYDPNIEAVIGWDNEVWQFNFEFLESEAFRQDRGETYWLGVKHTLDLDGSGMVDALDIMILSSQWPAAYGWKTADVWQYPDPYTGEHFLDDAVWIDVDTFGTDGHVVPGGGAAMIWNELFNPFTGDSLDLAFVITPEPASAALLVFGGVAILLRRRRRHSR